MGLDSVSIIGALHDVVEDTEFTVKDIEKEFEKNSQNNHGLTKSRKFLIKMFLQQENFRKMLLTFSDDIRVILIKIVDRLHNMRTLFNVEENN